MCSAHYGLQIQLSTLNALFYKIFQGANIDENGTTSIPGGLCQSQKMSLANQSLRGSKLNISGSNKSDYDSLF